MRYYPPQGIRKYYIKMLRGIYPPQGIRIIRIIVPPPPPPAYSRLDYDTFPFRLA